MSMSTKLKNKLRLTIIIHNIERHTHRPFYEFRLSADKSWKLVCAGCMETYNVPQILHAHFRLLFCFLVVFGLHESHCLLYVRCLLDVLCVMEMLLD